MSLENKISSLSYSSNPNSRSGKDVSKMGTIFKAPSNVSDIDRTAIPVDNGSKSKINRTIPVEDLPQKEEIVIVQEEPVSVLVEKVEVIEPEIKNIQLNSSGSSRSGSKL
jgi:hypothetical protein